MKSKILFIVSSLRKSGPIVVLQNIISHLDLAKYDVEIVKLTYDEPKRSITHQFKNAGIHIHELDFSKLVIELFPWRVAKRIEGIIAEIKPDIIHTHGYQAVLVTSRLKNPILKIETLHCISGEDFVLTKGRVLGTYMNLRYLKALKTFDGAAAISNSVENYYHDHIKSLNIRVIPNGVQDLPLSVVSKEDIRKKFKISPDTFVFAVVGSLIIRKDPLTIIKAFKKAFPEDAGSKIELWFIGKGPLYNKCIENIAGDNRIKMLGWRANVYDYLRVADWSVSASHSEGFGLNYIESLVAGTPMIATKIPAFSEFSKFFQELKEFEFLPGDIDTLSLNLIKATNAQIDMANMAKEAQSRFSSKSMAENYTDFYNDLINQVR